MSDHPHAEGSTCYLPDFCGIRSLLGVLLTAELLALLITLAAEPSGIEAFWSELGLRLLFICWIALVSAAALCGCRRLFNRLAPLPAGAAVFVLVEMITLVVSWAALRLLDGADSSLDPVMFYARNLGICGMLIAAMLRYWYIQAQWRAQVRSQSEAQWRALQARIRPHFLFNSLNTVLSLVRGDPERAEGLIQDLADLFRASLADNTGLVPLAQEVDLARQYLNIEHSRLGERLRVDWDLARLPMDALVPSLSLQPLLENAVYHGIEPSPENGWIRIGGRRRQDRLLVSVKNSLPVQSGRRTRPQNRMALANLDARLRHAYGERGRMLISAADASYQVTLSFPYRRGCDEIADCR